MSRTKKCPMCSAPCNTYVEPRGGDGQGWGTSDAERTRYKYAPPAQEAPPTVVAQPWAGVTDAPTEEFVELGIGYARNYVACRLPSLSNTAKEHIEGLCDLLEKVQADRARLSKVSLAGGVLFAWYRRNPRDWDIVLEDDISERADSEKMLADGWIPVYTTEQAGIDTLRSQGGVAQGVAPFDFRAHLQRQRDWSGKTFGPGQRTAGVVDHIRKELREIEADPTDVSEWIDVTILALDGAWRAGYSPDDIIAALIAKQAKNEERVWPDWRTMPADKAIEHDRSVESPTVKCDAWSCDDGEVIGPYDTPMVCGKCGGTGTLLNPRYRPDLDAALAPQQTEGVR